MISETHSGCATVLAFEGAIALLESGVPDDPSTRETIAAPALRRTTGRNDILLARRWSGRPSLSPPYPELGVSMSARGTLLLVGFSATLRAGVDIETEHSVAIDEVARLASDHFSKSEAEAIHARGAIPAARDLFLRLWVAKEAALKLTGRGVFDGLREPCFGRDLDPITTDGTIIELAATSSVPGLRAAVCRLPPQSGEEARGAVYCALAVCAP